MTPCFSSRQPAPSSRERFLLACSRFVSLEAGADLTPAFDELRALLLDVLSGANDPHAYQLSLTTLTRFGPAELERYAVTGDPTQLREIVEQSAACLP